MKSQHSSARAALLSTICLGSLGFASAAFAQAAPAAPVAETDVVVVTAAKREQTLQSIPVAVSVTSADTIEKAKVRDLNDIQTLVPSLRVTTNQSSTNSTFIIRGFGNGANNNGIEPSVAIFIDGVYRSRAGAAIGDLPNLQRVEVLRGPQSTLFGKNASAGVISIVTREPKFEPGGSVEVSYGNFNAIVAKADITGPLGENAAGSLAFGINTRDGYVKNLGLGIDVNNRDRFNVRGDLLIRPSDTLKVRVIADYDKLDESCCAVANILDGPTGGAVRAIGGKIVSNSPFSDTVYSDVPPVNEVENRGISMQLDADFGKLTFTSISAYRNSNSFGDGDVDFTSAGLASVYQELDINTLTQEFRITSNYDGAANFLLGGFLFKEEIEQKSGVVYGKDFRNYANILSSNNLTPIEAALGFPAGTFQKAGTGTTEDLGMDDFAKSLFGTLDYKVTDKLILTVGFNYTDDAKKARLNILSTDTFSGLDLNAIGAALTLQGLGPAISGGLLTLAQAQALVASISGVRCPATGAPPGLPTCNALLGLTALQFQPPFLNIPNAVESGRTNDAKTSYSVRLAWEINDNFNAYASYATGFKASSFNLSRDSRPLPSDFSPGNPITNPAPSKIRSAGLAVTNLTTGTRFAGPEEATVMEIGLKARFPKGAFNLTLFDQQIDGFQSNSFTGTGFILANAGTQSTKGVEFDATYRPIRPLFLTFAATWLDPLFDDFKGGQYGDYSGRKPAGIAEFTYNASATFVQPLASGARISYRADYYSESETQLVDGVGLYSAVAIPNLAARNAANLKAAEAYTRKVDLLNGSISLNLKSGLELSLWGRNLTDDRFLTTIFNSVAQDGSLSGYPSQPRTYGVSAKYVF